MRMNLLTSSILALSVAAPTALAHQAGDIIVRAGAVTVTTGESTSGVVVDRSSVADVPAGTNLGGEATLDNNTQLGLNLAYMVTDKFAVELLGATPFEHDVAIKGTGAVDGALGKVKHLPPTLSAVYFPMDAGSAFQPYVGLGVNYTWFFDEKASAGAKAGENDKGYPLDNLKVKNSWGWAAQVGADYMLTEKVMLNGQIRYIDIDTEATVDVAGGAAHAVVDVDIKPMVYMLGVGYKF